MSAAPHCSRPHPEWGDVRDSIGKLINFSRRLPVLRQNLTSFNMEIDCLSCMLETLMASLDRQTRAALRPSVTSFISSADQFIEFATKAVTGEIDLNGNELVTAWAERWEEVSQSLGTLSDDIQFL